MNTYQWRVTSLAVVNQDSYTNVVKTAAFIITATDPTGQYSADYRESVQLNTDDLSNFTPFESLTEAQVIAWVQASFTEEQMAALLVEVDRTLAEDIARPKTVQTLPWIQAQPLAPEIVAVPVE